MPTVTACVVVKDRRELMLRCLDALLAQQPVADQIVVVDNGSTDGTLEAVRRRAVDEPRLLVEVDTGSLGRARNTAARLATSDVVAFTDSDCVAAPGWLAAGLAAFDGDDVGVVQGRTVPEHRPTQRWSATQDIPAPSGLFEACNVFYRRRALLAAGGFDETIGFFGEDTAAGWSVLRAGWQQRWAPDALVRHAVTTPGLGWHLRRARNYANWPALMSRYPEQRALLWRGVFLRPRSAVTDAALAGVVMAALLRRSWPLAATAPFLWRHRPRGLTRAALADSAGDAAFDIAVAAALLRGSLRERTPVL